MKRLFLLMLFAFLFIGAQGGPPPTTITIPNKAYAPGDYTLPSTAFPAGISTATMTLDRTNWTSPTATITFKIDLSSDGGNTWFTGSPAGSGWCAFTSKGGVLTDPSSGTTITSQSSTCYCTLSAGCNPANSTNRVRGTVTVSGGTITTGGSVVMK